MSGRNSATSKDKHAERTLPANLEAERSILGAILVHSEAYHDVSDVVVATDFYRDAHQRIFAAIAALIARQVTPDFVTLKEELARRGDLDEVGGPAYVASLADGVPRATNAVYYAAVVRDKASRRDLIIAANQILTDAYSEEHETATEAMETAERAIFDVATRRNAGNTLVEMPEMVQQARAMIERVHETGQSVTGVPTGLTDLDARTRGMHPGQLVVVAGRPGLGKSTLGFGIARHVAATDTVLGFSLEMSREELGLRLVTADAHVDGHRLQQGHIPTTAWSALSDAMNVLHGAHLLIDDTPYRTVTQIRSISRRVLMQRCLRLIVIDYLGLMAVERRRGEDKRTLELADMTRSLKLLAKELRLPILLLCQLNRDPEKGLQRARRPRLSDLAESGAIERDADQVWFIHRPDEDLAEVEIIVAKNRSGPKAIAKVAYFEEQYRFANLAVNGQV